jgi:hypothetical protein
MSERRDHKYAPAPALSTDARTPDVVPGTGEVWWDLARVAERPTRTVSLPRNRSLGDLFLLSPSALRPGETRTSPLGRARGEVTVPAGKRLRLVMNEKSARDLRPLARLNARDLYSLDLSHCQIKDDQLIHLRGLTWLGELDLGCNIDFSGRGLAHLAGLKTLRSLNLSYTWVTPRGYKELCVALPRCWISWSQSST